MAVSDNENNNNLGERIVIGDTTFNETDLLTLKTLTAAVFTNSHATAREFGSTSGYQVPALKKFVIKQEQFSNATSGSKIWGIGSSTSDVGFDSSSAPTGVEQSGIALGHKSAQVQMNPEDLTITIPAGRYIYFSCNDGTSATIEIYGHELDA